MGGNGGEWSRLAAYLMHRRIDLGYPTRSAFQDVVASNSGQRRTILDVENSKRTNYGPSTLAWLEHAYRWRPGSIAAVLAGDEPECLDDSAADDRVVVAINSNGRVRRRRRPHVIEGFDADQIRYARALLGKTVEEMAQIAGVSCRTYLSWERGENVPPVGKIGSLLDYLRERGLGPNQDDHPRLTSVELAIMHDSRLDDDDAAVLIDIYRHLARRPPLR